jgi:hypothetical protein
MFKKFKHNRDAIVYPTKGALALLKAHENNSGLNLATTRRALEWCWSTYNYLYDELGPFKHEVKFRILALDKAVKNFDFDSATNTEDLWDMAMEEYNR